MTTQSHPQQRAQRLLAFLRERKDDRGLLADLRSGLVPARVVRAWPHLAPFGGCDEGHESEVVRTLAALFAHAPGQVQSCGHDFGATWRHLALATDKKEGLKAQSTFSKHLMHLLAANREEVCERVAKLALRASGKDIAVDFTRLYVDLVFWSAKPRSRWAVSFWGGMTDSEHADQEEARA